jgi:hypothetical protein
VWDFQSYWSEYPARGARFSALRQNYSRLDFLNLPFASAGDSGAGAAQIRYSCNYYPSRFSRAATIFGAVEAPARPVADARGSVLGQRGADHRSSDHRSFVVRPAFSVCGEGALGVFVRFCAVGGDGFL